MTPPAGYSGTPLVKKPGVKPGFRIKSWNAPKNDPERLQPLPEGSNAHLVSLFKRDLINRNRLRGLFDEGYLFFV
jgi:hypothetical protein